MITRYEDRPVPKAAVTGFVLWMLMLSATLVETDAYRYAAIFVSIYGLYTYYTMRPRPRASFIGWTCLVWALYVLTRFLFDYFDTANREHGSSEWLFAFPLFFPVVGIGLIRMRFYVEKLLAVFFSLAALLLIVSQHWLKMAKGLPVIPLYHNNQIHGAVACGMIMIGAFYWFLHYADGPEADSVYGRLSRYLAPVIAVLCLLSIVGSQAKGVWLALVVTLPIAVVVLLTTTRHRTVRRGLAGFFAVVALVIAIFHRQLATRLDKPLEALLQMVRDYRSSTDFTTFMQQQIDGGHIPSTISSRLEIWYNAIEVIRQAPWFGHGNMWIELWEHTRYVAVGFTLMHNGYLEILIRHGWFGMAVMTFLVVAFLRMAYRGYRNGVIGIAALQAYWMLLIFFMITLLSNSNNRLAIGESFAILWGGVAFYCQATSRYRALIARETVSPAPAVLQERLDVQAA